MEAGGGRAPGGQGGEAVEWVPPPNPSAIHICTCEFPNSMEPNIVLAYGCSGDLVAATAPPEYRCVTRLRRRRLLSFLWLHGFKSTFEAMAEEVKMLVSLPHLERLITNSMWDDAIDYTCC